MREMSPISLLKWARIRSPWILHFNSGACNACDIEVLALLTPRYDVERFGILPKGTPRHSDVLVATGPVTRQAAMRLKRIYELMPEPKFVIAVGTCASSGAPFNKCYNVLGGLDKVVPVDVYVPGCPPKPEAIMYGITKLLEKIKEAEG
jgi:NADH-quinone oxidoreductase B subunit